jgi:biopolymer transport protein ExbD
MAVSLGPQSTGKHKKPLDAELNLIPFIDLLVCCVCFLLITAVWIQMARIDVSHKSKGPGGREVSPMVTRVAVLVGDEGYTISVGAERLTVPKRGLLYDTEGLKKRLVQVRTRLPETSELTVAAEDEIKYRHLVGAMDVALQSHFSRIQVSDAAARL